MAKKNRIEVYEGGDRKWYWRCRHRNGHIVADGAEGYSTESNARRAARRVGISLTFASIQRVENHRG